MSLFISQVETQASHMTVVGAALETISELLGCDGAEHYLNDEQMLGLAHAVQALGLAHAVQALGAGIRERGYALYGLAEEERCK